MLRFFLLFLLFHLSFMLASASAQGGENYREALLQRATALQLADSLTWTRLLHYERGWFSPFGRSSIDSPDFFVSESGKSDPRAELAATIDDLFQVYPDGKAFRCRFPARFHVLRSTLNIDDTRLPKSSCQEFDEWEASINAHSVTVIYPAAYLNNPASMFGHTLLRFDAENQNESTRLLAYGASYAASTTETSGFIFAFRGIFGLYKGSFSVSPYYKLVRDYSEIENRDIWEYELTLSPDEVRQIVRHLWEVGTHWLDYYFFDENCSYELLALLEGAIPRLNLTEEFSLWVLPPETLRVLTAEPGLIGKAHFRAAKSTLVREEERRLNSPEVRLAKKIALGEQEVGSAQSLPTQEKEARVLELSYDYLEYLQNIGKKGGQDAGKRARELLLARNALGTSFPNTVVPRPKVRPEEGHRGGKLGTFWGADHNGSYEEIRFRPAFHELIDPEEGYARGGELKFFDARLRYQRDAGVQLQSFTPLSIQSLTPRSELFSPISWKVDGSVERYRSSQYRGDFLSNRFELGAGLTQEESPSLLMYEMMNAQIRQSKAIDGGFAYHLGPEVGMLLDLNQQTRLKGNLRYLLDPAELRQNDMLMELQGRFSLSSSFSIQASLQRASQMGFWRNQFEIGLSYFF